jgi:hypothetical protein
MTATTTNLETEKYIVDFDNNRVMTVRSINSHPFHTNIPYAACEKQNAAGGRVTFYLLDNMTIDSMLFDNKADAQAELEKRQARTIVNRAAMRQAKANHRN